MYVSLTWKDKRKGIVVKREDVVLKYNYIHSDTTQGEGQTSTIADASQNSSKRIVLQRTFVNSACTFLHSCMHVPPFRTRTLIRSDMVFGHAWLLKQSPQSHVVHGIVITTNLWMVTEMTENTLYQHGAAWSVQDLRENIGQIVFTSYMGNATYTHCATFSYSMVADSQMFLVESTLHCWSRLDDRPIVTVKIIRPINSDSKWRQLIS